MLVFGTRPEAIKMCPLVKELQKHDEDFRTVVCVTGQHREMLDQVLRLFGVKPDFDLNLMRPGQDLTDLTAHVLTSMRDVFRQCRPDMVLVHGDTTTSVAAALAAFYAQIPVGHVEAGLRTYNMQAPWPEELNRQLTGRIAALNFAATPKAEQNLRAEHVMGKVYVTGNTVIDALFLTVKRQQEDAALVAEIRTTLLKAGFDTERLSQGRRLVLITGHRRENLGDGLTDAMRAIRTLSELYPMVDFVYPMHLNPVVRQSVREVMGEDLGSRANLFFIEPLQYNEFVYLMANSALVLTDSGGIQEEAPSLGKPVLVMRNTTERPEALTTGLVHLVGTDSRTIVEAVRKQLDAASTLKPEPVTLYGDGRASERIVQILKQIDIND